MRLANKVAVITGSGRGVGRVVAVAFAAEGAKVVVNGLTPEKVDEVAAEIREAGGVAAANYDSVATLDGAERIIQTAIEQFGRIDVLVNNAVVQHDAMMHKMTEREWDEVIAVGLKGPWACTKAALPHMRQQGSGSIINVTSSAGWMGNIGQANYCAAKGGVVSLTKANAKEFGRYNIRVNAIAPSLRTRMQDSIPPHVFQSFVSQRALGRMPEAHELSGAFILLASDESTCITGQVLSVNCGLGI